MKRFAVTVEFEIFPGYLGEFLEILSENARNTIDMEDRCYRFDILTPAHGDSETVFLYELYADESAFEHHLRAGHFLDFDTRTAPMVASKLITKYLVSENFKAADQDGRDARYSADGVS